MRWTLRLLANQLVDLGYVETVSYETVRQVLLASVLKPWIKKQWCIPTAPDAEFIQSFGQVTVTTGDKPAITTAKTC